MTTVVLHGFTGSAATMADLAGRLDGDVVVPDLAGHGLGPHSSDPSEYTVGAMAQFVVGLATGPIDLVGYSMGGRVALTAACRWPERVRSLSLIGASAGLTDAEDRRARVAADEQLAGLIESDLEAFVDLWMANPLFASQAKLGDEFLAAARQQRLQNDPSGLAMSLREAGTGRMVPLHDLLHRCDMPVSLIVGEHDAKFRAIAVSMAESLPDADLYMIGGAGHAAHLEQPDAVAAAIAEIRSRT